MKTQSVTEVIWGDMDLLRSSAVTSTVRAYTTKLLTFCLFFVETVLPCFQDIAVGSYLSRVANFACPI